MIGSDSLMTVLKYVISYEFQQLQNIFMLLYGVEKIKITCDDSIGSKVRYFCVQQMKQQCVQSWHVGDAYKFWLTPSTQ